MKANIKTNKATIENHDLGIFVATSMFLTGYDAIELVATGMAETYFNVVMNKNPVAVVQSFLVAADDIIKRNKDNPEKLNEEILNQLMPDALYDGLAQNIITMWYMGNWMNEMVSSQAYIQGLVWKTAGSHPPGAQQPGYGSWHNPPLATPLTIQKK